MKYIVVAEKNINVELLRVISMLMILMLHYFNQGKVLELTKTGGITYYLVWIVEGICFISVNLYMLISGYFLSNKRFSWKRLISFYITVLFYSVVISVICFSTGIATCNLKTFLSVFPIVGSRSNWFVTIYVAILLISPILNTIANTLGKALYKRMLIVLFILFSIFPTFFFWSDQFNVHHGYSILWYSYLYLLAAYIQRFSLTIKGSFSLLMFFSLALLPFTRFLIVLFFSKTILFSAKDILYSYNSFPVFFAALAVFVAIINNKKMMIRKPLTQSAVLFLGKTSFGVFFIHSFVLIRDKLWIAMGSKHYIGCPYQIIHGLICIIIIYLLCSIIDSLKASLFSLSYIDNNINKWSNKLDRLFPLY